MSEFQLIELIRQRAGDAGSGVNLGIGDDCALVSVPAGFELAATMDTLNSGVHFDPETDAESIGHKALAVNLSDLAAMGAKPMWVLLSISIPNYDRDWLVSLIDGFLTLAENSNVSLIGGDTCSGALSISVTALGIVPSGQALTRAGASPGDLVVVSGHPGDAAFALSQAQAGTVVPVEALNALHRPLPRIALGLSLVGKATACIDISDGLLADLGHIVNASGCGAVIEPARIACSTALQAIGPDQRWRLQLTGGDDYELCFTLPPSEESCLADLAHELGTELSVVGTIAEGSGVRCIAPSGRDLDFGLSGYEHFV